MSAAQAIGTLVREARPEDNDTLVALAARCPMDGDLSMCVDRAPNFFQLNALEGDPWRVGVLDGPDGNPVACIGVARRYLHIGGKPQHVAYIGDLKVDPDHRRSKLAVALAYWAQQAAIEMVGAAGIRISTVLQGNNPIETAMNTGAVPNFAMTVAGTVRSHSIPLLGRRRVSRGGGPVVDRAVRADIPEMARLWQRLAPERACAPVYDEESLAAWIESGPGLSASDYLLARRPGDDAIVGFLGLWDQHRIKQTRVIAYSPQIAWVPPLFNLVSPLLGAARLPGKGSELRYRSVVNLCVSPGDTATLRALLAYANNWLRREDYSFLTLGLDLDDPLSGALRGMLPQPTDVSILADYVTDQGQPPELGGGPLHFEISTV